MPPLLASLGLQEIVLHPRPPPCTAHDGLEGTNASGGLLGGGNSAQPQQQPGVMLNGALATGECGEDGDGMDDMWAAPWQPSPPAPAPTADIDTLNTPGLSPIATPTASLHVGDGGGSSSSRDGGGGGGSSGACDGLTAASRCTNGHVARTRGGSADGGNGIAPTTPNNPLSVSSGSNGKRGGSVDGGSGESGRGNSATIGGGCIARHDESLTMRDDDSDSDVVAIVSASMFEA